jgi:hypothetical protein
MRAGLLRRGSTASSMSACLTHVRSDSTPQPSCSATRSVRGAQLLAQLTHQAHRPSLLLRRMPTCRRSPRRDFVSHGSILVSKVKSLQPTQGGSDRQVRAGGN